MACLCTVWMLVPAVSKSEKPKHLIQASRERASCYPQLADTAHSCDARPLVRALGKESHLWAFLQGTGFLHVVTGGRTFSQQTFLFSWNSNDPHFCFIEEPFPDVGEDTAILPKSHDNLLKQNVLSWNLKWLIGWQRMSGKLLLLGVDTWRFFELVSLLCVRFQLPLICL